MTRTALGNYGFSVNVHADDTHLATALTIESLGFGTLWINGGALDRLDRLTDLLRATSTSMVGSSIIPPDRYGPADVSRLYESAEKHAPGRLVVGLGSPHRHDALTVLQQYLGKLEVPPQRRMLAAFGPRALRVAR
ncbi:LLM class F420-dependent oxidoreductase, partial [Mycobacterium sp. ITM-2017-0098]